MKICHLDDSPKAIPTPSPTAALPVGKVVSIAPRKVWIESGMCGERAVMIQHEGCHAFEYAVFNYDYAYTSNAGTINAATQLALALGATEPVEHRLRPFDIGRLQAEPNSEG